MIAMTSRMHAGGTTLIEVLVALLLLTVGALGAQATLLSSRGAAQQSALLSSAVQVAASAADTMRANSAAMAVADAANPYLQLDFDAASELAPTAPPDCSLSSCDSATLAQADLDALRLAISSRFPLGRIRICRDGASWNAAATALRWECDGAAGAPAMVKIGWRAPLGRDGVPVNGAAPLVALPVALPALATAAVAP